MSAKSDKGAETKRRILEAAIDLFHTQGIHATSPDDVIEASGTGKGQFYYYFKNKLDLVHEIFKTHLHAIKSGTGPISYEVESWRDFEACLLAHVDLQKKFHMARGCFFGTVGNELTDNDELIRQDLNLVFEVISNKFANFFSTEQAREHMRKDADPARLADFCVASLQGAMLMGKIKQDSGIVESVIHEILAHVNQYRVAESLAESATESRHLHSVKAVKIMN